MSIDIVIPCYNYGRYLKRCIDSILDQGVEFRVLIIDDCSPADPAPDSIVELDPRIELRRHAANMRHIATYNEGLLGWCKAPYSLLLSADDWLAPGALRRAIDYLESHPDCGFFYGRAFVSDGRDDLQMPDIDATEHTMTGEEYTLHVCRSANPVPTPCAVVRTALQHELGGYRPDLPHSGDMEMWLRFATRANVGTTTAVQACYHWHGGNMGANHYLAPLSDLREQYAACDGPLTHWPVWMSHILCDRLSREAFWLAHRNFEGGEPAAADQCIRFALEMNPRMGAWTVPRDAWMFAKYRLKRWMGYRKWAYVQLLARRLRGLPSHATRAERFHIGQLTGWVPT